VNVRQVIQAAAHRGSSARYAALLLLGSVVVHQSRYLIEHVTPGEHEVYQARHAYLATLIPSVVVLAALAAIWFVLEVVRASRTPVSLSSPSAPLSFARLWCRSAAALAFIFSLQESSESVLSGQALDVLSLSFVRSAWVVLILAAVVGAGVALLARGAQAVLARAVGIAVRPFVYQAGAQLRPPERLEELRALIIGRGTAGRAPPRVALAD
jgi:hypothetical protein